MMDFSEPPVLNSASVTPESASRAYGLHAKTKISAVEKKSDKAAAHKGKSAHRISSQTVAFSHVTTWIFDLDNTLYPHEAQLWPQVDDRITVFLSELLGTDGLSARALQKYFYYRYGTTLKGLMEEQGTDPHEFLDFVHQINLDKLYPDPALSAAIALLPGRKLIMTNGSRRHAENVAGKLGILHHFEDIFDIVAADLIPKPEIEAYALFLRKYNIDPQKAAMFEDIARNLEVPHALGMVTTLVLPKTIDPFRELHEQIAVNAPYVDFTVQDLTAHLLRSVSV
jgi:putative hydrolase of the HAD superfamily